MKKIRSHSSSFSESGTQSDEDFHFIEIKKEKKKTINIETKLYERLITFININNNILMNMKNRNNVIKFSESTQTDEEIIKNEIQKDLKAKEKEIKNLKAENFVLKNELNKYKTQYLDIEKKYNELKNIYEPQMKDKLESIIKLNNELNNLNEIIKLNKEKMKHMVEYSSFEKVFDNDKLVDKILNYLPIEYYLTLASLNKKIHFHLYYKKKCAYIENKCKKSEKLIQQLITSNIPMKYQIEEEEIINLIKKYTEPHLIPGNKMRYSLFHSLKKIRKNQLKYFLMKFLKL